jgi:acid phosphatase family membrane protein YuiD
MTFYDLITNEVLIIPLCAWAIAQLIKLVAGLARERFLNLRYLIASGGMPSSHTAIVCALATAVAMTQGLNSVAFAITAILAMVVMYDAAGVRHSVSKQSVILNHLIRDFRTRRPKDEIEHELREFIGHTPFQVIIGALLGIFIAWLWLFIRTL